MAKNPRELFAWLKVQAGLRRGELARTGGYYRRILIKRNNLIEMAKKSLEIIVQEGIRFLARFFPQSQYLYFPLLSAALVWAIKSSREWRENIFSWEVWLDPSFVEVKPDGFILDFFTHHTGLAHAFDREIKAADMTVLRKHFYYLYPIVGLEDPFLSGLFQQELASQDYRAVVQDYDRRVAQAVVDIEALEEKGKFMDGLEAIAREMASFGTDMITQASVQRALFEVIKKELDKDGN
jgi:hypothetical protein